MSATNEVIMKPGRSASVYSELETSRLNVSPPLPSVLKSSFRVVHGPKTSATGNPGSLHVHTFCVLANLVHNAPTCADVTEEAPTSSFFIKLVSNGYSISSNSSFITRISSLTSFSLYDGYDSTNVDEIAKHFPNLFGQPSVSLKSGGSLPQQSLKIGIVLSGGQAPGGHNVISGIYDYFRNRTQGSTMYGFIGGPVGIMKCNYVKLTEEFIYPYRNQGGFDMICSGRDKIETPEQFQQARETAKKLDLDGIVVIGGDDSNTNACLLAENFRANNLKTRVIGCPKTIDGDLKCKEVPASFGFDTACKIYSEMIGNLMVDARSTGKYYHFVRLMGRAASHITLECALQTHPNIAIIGEEVAAQKQTLKSVTSYIANIICKRADAGYSYGIVLVPEGLVDFIPEVRQLIAELNEILAHDVVDQKGAWKKKLRSQSHELFEILPQAIQEQLLLERDPHGNVQVVAKIETEKMLIQMVECELEKRKKEGRYKKNFKAQPHFFGYEGRCGLPSIFDSNYCYALGYGAAALIHTGKTGLISSVGNLGAPVEDWTVGGTALTSLMGVERRQGKFKPVVKKAMVELEGAPFKKFASMRDEWSLKNRYINPGPVQFMGPASDCHQDHSGAINSLALSMPLSLTPCYHRKRHTPAAALTTTLCHIHHRNCYHTAAITATFTIVNTNQTTVDSATTITVNTTPPPPPLPLSQSIFGPCLFKGYGLMTIKKAALYIVRFP
ncbi:hypothetical protein E3N88_08852 [Mikania micrantha]|uniref:Pyrophosphate--fructose 6-phosphate 1-phosphotransferase subunit beta n=1 Tax=Mikania micrantha TaxID=192012 RepID=A0A5N6PJP9_9ASTR|nr:hypothetical protein E3N88_08852 [Mikania micrantha]